MHIAGDQLAKEVVDVEFAMRGREFVKSFLIASVRQKPYWFFLVLVAAGIVMAFLIGEAEAFLAPMGLLAMLIVVPLVMALFRVRTNPRLLANHKQKFSNDGVGISSEFGEGTLKWSAIDRVIESGGIFFMYSGRQPINVLPLRVFPTPRAREPFQDLCRANASTNF